MTVGRGHSAMVPIVSSDLRLPQGPALQRRQDAHPSRGDAAAEERDRPDAGARPGDRHRGGRVRRRGGAALYASTGGEIVVPYAVELGVKVREEGGSSREIRGLSIKGAYLQFEEWEIRWREYQLNNSTGKALTVLVEHPRTAYYDLFDTPEPQGAHRRAPAL